MNRFERKTGKMRQVLCEAWDNQDSEGVRYRSLVYRYFKIQEQWKVQTGDPYTPMGFGPPNRPCDEFMHADGCGVPIWLPCQLEWRDMETVTEEEANANRVSYE